MSNPSKVQIDVQANAPTGPIEKFGLSLKDLQTLLKQAQNDFAAAAPGTAEYTAAVTKVGELSQRISEVIRPVREYAETQARAAAETAKAAAAMQQETQAVKAAEEAQKALNRAKREQAGNQRQDAVANAHRQFAADLREAEQSTARLAVASRKVNDEQRKTPPLMDAAKTSTRNTGAAVLAFSQGLEDAQYGIRGVLNNIPGLVMTLGGSMGLAGVISVAAVALSVLTEWFGKTKVAAEKLNWAKLTPEEAAIERLDKYTESIRKQSEAIDAQAAAWDRRTAATNRNLEAEEKRIAHEAKMRELNVGNGDPLDTLNEYDKRRALNSQRQAALDGEATGAKVNAERQAESAARLAAERQAQEKRVADLTTRAEVEGHLLGAQDKARKAREDMAAREVQTDGRMPEAESKMHLENIAKAQAVVDRFLRQLTELPTLNADAYKQGKNEAEAKAFYFNQEQEKLKALRAAESEAQKAAADAANAAKAKSDEVAKAQADLKRQQAEDDKKTEDQVAQEAGLPAPLPRMPGEARDAGGRMDLLDPANRPLISRPEPPAPEPEDTYGPEYEAEEKRRREEAEVNEAAGKLRDSIGSTKDSGVKAMLEGLLAMLTDGQGDTQAELAQVREMYASLTSGKVEVVGALTEAVRGVAEINQKSAAAMSRIVDILGGQGARIEAVNQRLEAFEKSMRN